MRRQILSACLALITFITGCSLTPGRDPGAALDRIREADVRRNLFFLASDSLKGRNTPSPELDSAGAHIAREFARSGLRPVNGSYFQRVPLNSTGLGEPNSLRVRSASGEKSYEIKTDFTPFEMTASKEVRAPIVFVGYGITAAEYHYDDYAGIETKGKIVFVLRHEPGEEDSLSVFKGRKATEYSSIDTKVRIAIEHGAIGVMVATDPLNHTSLVPRGFPWPSLSRIIPRDALPLTLGVDESSKIPVIHVGEAVIDQLFGSVESLRALQAKIDSSMVPCSFTIAGADADIRTTTDVKVSYTSNVVGVLPGSDSTFRSEVVIVGAHYDHVGQKKDHKEGERYIYNGADDNASGTCAMLGVAAGLGGLPAAPRRSIVCIAFAGEEKGLFGSEYYTRNPLFPLKNTVAMLNMDMVGRNAADTLLLVGSDLSPDLARITREENERVGFVLVDFVLRNGGSDHMSFMKQNIPNLFLHSGDQPELHSVNDRPELIDIRKVTRAAELAFLTAYHIANDTVRYHYTPTPITLF